MWWASYLKTSHWCVHMRVRIKNNAVSEIGAIKASPPRCKQRHSAPLINMTTWNIKKSLSRVFFFFWWRAWSQKWIPVLECTKVLRKKKWCRGWHAAVTVLHSWRKTSQGDTVAMGSTHVSKPSLQNCKEPCYNVGPPPPLLYLRKAASFFSMFSKESIPM